QNDDVLTEFLTSSLRVPDLILPNHIFPKPKPSPPPPSLSLQNLTLTLNPKFIESVSSLGCFQIVNHGIEREIVKSAMESAKGVFELSKEKKSLVKKKVLQGGFGFEDDEDEEEEEEEERENERREREEFVWGREEDENLKVALEGIWPHGYSYFRERMEVLMNKMGEIAEKILPILSENFLKNSTPNGKTMGTKQASSICCLHRQCQNIPPDQFLGTIRCEVIRMLIRGIEYSHALCLHLCDGVSEFHVYSKKGWVSFCPDHDALVVTIGDQIQTWSGGHFKHVIGRPIFKGEDEDKISLAFLYSPPSIINNSDEITKEKTISLGLQFILAILLTLAYQFLIHMFKKF
ncbi:Non-hem dioxygenase N-terminal domain, partial [Dillenia turbinata]